MCSQELSSDDWQHFYTFSDKWEFTIWKSQNNSGKKGTSWAHLAHPPPQSRASYGISPGHSGLCLVGLECLQGWRLRALLLVYPHGEDDFLHVKSETPLLRCTTFVSCPPTVRLWTAWLSLRDNLLAGTVGLQIDHPKAIASPGQMSPEPSASLYRLGAPAVTKVVAPHRTCPWLSVSFLYRGCGTWNWTQSLDVL